MKYRCAKIYNNEDLLGNEVNNKLTFDIYIDKFIYKFTYEDLIKIIKNNLLNYDSDTTGAMITNNFLTPLEIKNPYTNVYFSKSSLYNIYFKIHDSTFNMPILFERFFQVNFNLDLFKKHNDVLLKEYLFNSMSIKLKKIYYML